MDLAITPPGRRLPRSSLTPPPETTWPRMRASAVLFRLAADQLDDASPSETARSRASELIRIGMMGPCLSAFLTTLESVCGMNARVAGDAAECLIHGGSMPWEPWSTQEGFAGASGLEAVAALEGATAKLRSLFGGDFALTADSPFEVKS